MFLDLYATNNLGTIFTNSWGSEGCDYSLYSSQIDWFIHNNPEYTVVFAAGNDGPGTCTVGNPGTSKNSVTVGATMNTYHSFLDYENKGNYMVNESTRLVIDKARHELYSHSQLSDWSSRGPTLDGRIKPDIVFPGEFIMSSRSHPYKNQTNMLLLRGTSMATPLVASLITIIEERMKRTYGLGFISSSLKKNILVSSGEFLRGSSQKMELDLHGKIEIRRQNKTGLTKYDQGFGLVNLKRFLTGGFGFLDHVELYAFDKPHTMCFEKISMEGNDFISLVYDDVPAMPRSSIVTINDVNLRATLFQFNQTGLLENDTVLSTLNGNGVYGRILDDKNTVEQVRPKGLVIGDHIRVSVSSNGPIVSLRPDFIQSQYYSLVWSGTWKRLLNCPVDCTRWDLPYQCIKEDGEIGARRCKTGKYENECTNGPVLVVPKEGMYQFCDMKNCTAPVTFSTRIHKQTQQNQKRVLSTTETIHKAKSIRFGLVFGIGVTLSLVFLGLHVRARRRGRRYE